MTTSEDCLAPKPRNLTFEQAAAIPVAGFTALQGLRDKARVQRGQRVLIYGAGGGVGTFAVQIAKSLGAHVTAVSSTKSVDLVRSIGADEVIDYTNKDFTRCGQRYDVLFDIGANRSFADCRRVLARNGILVLVGAPARPWAIVSRLLKAQLLSRIGRQRIASFLAGGRHEDLVVLKELAEAGRLSPDPAAGRRRRGGMALRMEEPSGRGSNATVAVFTVTLTPVGALSAANGDVPIYQPTTITAPGRYIVTRDITAQGDVIVILAGGVTLDLNGHTITSVTGSGVVLDMAGLPQPPCNIVANGRIVGGDTGIKGVNLPAVALIIVEKVGIVGPMFDCIGLPGSRLQVRGSVLRECGRDGIRMTGNGAGLVEVEDTQIADVGGSGIFANAIDGATVRASTIRRFGLGLVPTENAGAVRVVAPGKIGLSVLDSVLCDGSVRSSGLLLELAGTTSPVSISGNQIGGNGASGIDLRDGAARITGNTIAANIEDGIRMEAAGIVTPSLISGNSILDNILNGADIRAGVVRFSGNTVGGNHQDGVQVAGTRALVENNFLQGNTGAGLRFLNGSGHAYRGNFARGNNGGDIQDLFSNTDAGGNIK